MKNPLQLRRGFDLVDPGLELSNSHVKNLFQEQIKFDAIKLLNFDTSWEPVFKK